MRDRFCAAWPPLGDDAMRFRQSRAGCNRWELPATHAGIPIARQIVARQADLELKFVIARDLKRCDLDLGQRTAAPFFGVQRCRCNIAAKAIDETRFLVVNQTDDFEVANCVVGA